VGHPQQRARRPPARLRLPFVSCPRWPARARSSGGHRPLHQFSVPFSAISAPFGLKLRDSRTQRGDRGGVSPLQVESTPLARPAGAPPDRCRRVGGSCRRAKIEWRVRERTRRHLASLPLSPGRVCRRGVTHLLAVPLRRNAAAAALRPAGDACHAGATSLGPARPLHGPSASPGTTTSTRQSTTSCSTICPCMFLRVGCLNCSSLCHISIPSHTPPRRDRQSLYLSQFSSALPHIYILHWFWPVFPYGSALEGGCCLFKALPRAETSWHGVHLLRHCGLRPRASLFPLTCSHASNYDHDV
jgi:hypothetical protein